MCIYYTSGTNVRIRKDVCYMKMLLKDIFGIKNMLRNAILIIICSALCGITNALITSWIAQIIARANNNSDVIAYMALIVGGCAIVTVSDYLIRMLSFPTTRRAYSVLHNRLTNKLVNADYELFQVFSSSYITTVVESLTPICKIITIMTNIIPSALSIIFTMVAIGIISTRMVYCLVIIYAFECIVIVKLYSRMNRTDHVLDVVKHERNGEMQICINGFMDIRSMCTQVQHIKRIEAFNDKVCELGMKKTTQIGMTEGFCQLIDSLVTICAVVLAVVLIRKGIVVQAVAMSLIMYVWRITWPLVGCIDSLSDLSTITTAYERYTTLMSYTNKVTDGPMILSGFNNSICLKNVSFAYDTTNTVIDNISLDIKKGEKIGICGTSGEGKSTLLRLLNRFYDVDDGSICIDGVNIKNLTLNSLRKRIGMVHQRIYVFDGTIKENIVYGSPNASDNDVVEAAKKACLYDFIQSLPDKFNTNIGVDGLKLSGGQQQRIALARLFLLNPDIILLDEATSALDNESEMVVQDSLKEFSDKTIITVAHRLSTIMHCDRIVVLDNHKIVEIGAHQELLELDGVYAHLLNSKTS